MIEVNNVYNMDCIELMNNMLNEGYNGKVDLVLTDPPYGIAYKPRSGEFDIIDNDDLDEEKLYQLIAEYFKLSYNLLKDDSFLITFMGWQTIPVFNKALKDAGFTIKSMPIWVKNNFGMGYYTRPQYEPMYLCIKGKPKPPKTVISNIIKANRVQELVHSCQKPIDLLSILINTFSQPGELVFDGFGGSFSTCIASRKCGRNYISCEINKKLFEIGKANLYNETNQLSLFD